MALPPSRWRRVSESEFPWERDALQWLADQLPNQEPTRMWSNFEFISNDGHINEVDALILTAKGLFLVEIKSRPAQRLSGDAYAWSWVDGGRIVETDNPLVPTDRKAKRLASLLAPFERKEGVRLPFIESMVFCSAPGLDIRLPANIATRVYGRGRIAGDGAVKVPGIVHAIIDPAVGPSRSERLIDASLAGALTTGFRTMPAMVWSVAPHTRPRHKPPMFSAQPTLGLWKTNFWPSLRKTPQRLTVINVLASRRTGSPSLKWRQLTALLATPVGLAAYRQWEQGQASE
jgi:Nuclease-related domain